MGLYMNMTTCTVETAYFSGLKLRGATNSHLGRNAHLEKPSSVWMSPTTTMMTDRQVTDRRTDGWTEREGDRQTERQTDRLTDTQINRSSAAKSVLVSDGERAEVIQTGRGGEERGG